MPWPSARPNAARTRSATRLDVSTLPATTAAGGRALSSEPSGAMTFDRPVGARGRRDVGVGEHADGEPARAAGDRERAVEVALVLLGRAGEVERQLVARDRRRQLQREVALARLEHVRRAALAVVERLEAGAHPPLGVVDRLRHRVLQAAAVVQLAQPLDAGAVGGELRAQVGAALRRLAHLLDELLDRVRVEPARLDHDALVRERGRVGGHAAGRRAADVGVVRAVGRRSRAACRRRRRPA